LKALRFPYRRGGGRGRCGDVGLFGIPEHLFGQSLTFFCYLLSNGVTFGHYPLFFEHLETIWVPYFGSANRVDLPFHARSIGPVLRLRIGRRADRSEKSHFRSAFAICTTLRFEFAVLCVTSIPVPNVSSS